MKLTFRFKLMMLAIYMLIAGFLTWLLQPGITRRRARRQIVALANELGGIDPHGVESFTVDPTSTLPATGGVGSSGRQLGYMRGSALNYVKLWDGGSGKTSFPLGISQDAPYQAGDRLAIRRLSAITGTEVGVSAGAITVDDWVYAAANGQIGSCAVGNPGTVWVIGKATKTVSGANLEITFAPMMPTLFTVTQANPNTYAFATPV